MPANKPNAQEELKLIEEAAREAGEIAMSFFRRRPEVWMKQGQSPVSQADLEVDEFLCRRLLAARPDYGWLSEETADTPERLSAPRTFVVDPIDGTRAFIDGRSTWCISIGLVEEGRAIAGVLACPAKGEFFSAHRNGGAWQNESPIAVSQIGETLTMAGPKKMIKHLPPELYSRVVPHAYVPSLAYRLAMVARGSLDATFIKPASHDWDLAAADIILAEAGGSIVDGAFQRPHYAGPDPRRDALAAGHGGLLKAMVDVVANIQD